MDDDLRRWLSHLPAALRGEPWPADPPLGGLSLLSADADHIQQFVFQSARLPEIRGASSRLDRLNRPLTAAAASEAADSASPLLPRSPAPLPPPSLYDILSTHALPTESITADPPGCVVFAGGGSLMALVPRALAPRLAAEMEALYPRHTDVATLTAVWQDVTPADVAGRPPDGLSAAGGRSLLGRLDAAGQARLRAAYWPPGGPSASEAADSAGGPAGESAAAWAAAFARAQGIGRVIGEQAARLQRRKRAKAFAPLVEADPFARRCRSCGRRPAVTTLDALPGEPPRYLCRVCAANDQAGRDQKSVWNEGFERWYGSRPGRVPGETLAQDLSAIGDGSAKRGFIGYVYADGNRVGRLLETAGSLRAYAELSQALTEAMRHAVYSALADHLPRGGALRPFEIITIGGDDALLIVPADAALPVAVALCRAFSAALAGRLPDPPTMSAGVVLAHKSNPIYFLRDLADQLLKNAKKAGGNSGRVDYMILKSQSTLATRLSDVRASSHLRVVNERSKERCHLTGRPYTLDETQRLLGGARALAEANLAPGQIHRLRQDLAKGRLPGLFQYLYQRARLREEPLAALAAVEAGWGLAAPGVAPSPWRPYPAPAANGYLEFDTPLLDLLELREFIA